MFEQLKSTASSLLRLVHVKIKYAEGINFILVSMVIQQKQTFLANFNKTYNTTKPAENKTRLLSKA